MNPSTTQASCRTATLADVDRLVALEQQCFDSDRISRRQFRHLLGRANAVVLVIERDGQLLGDVVVLFNRATSTARIYSIAVDQHGGVHVVVLGPQCEPVRFHRDADSNQSSRYVKIKLALG